MGREWPQRPRILPEPSGQFMQPCLLAFASRPGCRSRDRPWSDLRQRLQPVLGTGWALRSPPNLACMFRQPHPCSLRGESGSMTVVWSAFVGIIAAVALATASLGLAYSARAQAQVAADGAALAAAVATYPPTGFSEPAHRARSVAIANGAALESCRCSTDSSMETRVVTVVTSVAIEVPILGRLEVRAGARAEFDPRLWLGR